MKHLAVFASGTGTNFDAILKAIKNGEIDATIELVVVDKVDAPVIEKAKSQGILTFVFNPRDYENKAAYETEILKLLMAESIDLVVLAGYMRICGPTLLEAYEGRIINIHPSLLPAFQGKDAIGQAIAYGVKIMGVSIHYVDSGLDSGKIIAQACFEVGNMNAEQIETTIHAIEHGLYPRVIQQLLKGE